MSALKAICWSVNGHMKIITIYFKEEKNSCNCFHYFILQKCYKRFQDVLLHRAEIVESANQIVDLWYWPITWGVKINWFDKQIQACDILC